jgi:hypothetical protein
LLLNSATTFFFNFFLASLIPLSAAALIANLSDAVCWNAGLALAASAAALIAASC